MKYFIRICRSVGIALIFLITVLLVGYLCISHDIDQRADKTYHFKPDTPTGKKVDPALIAQGEHLVAIKGCNDCHATDLGGKVFLNEAGLGRISAPNLTAGKGGIGSEYSTTDWLMALRHGINREGRALWIMPSQETSALSKEDLNAIIAYCRQIEPVDRIQEDNNMGPMLKVMTFFDKVPLFPVEKIDHHRTAIADTRDMDQLQLGQYLSVSCIGCHRDNFRGGESPIPGMPPIPSIASTGAPGRWSQDQFIKTLRTGKTPAGHQMNNENMPWKMTAKYTDAELQALYAFLHTKK